MSSRVAQLSEQLLEAPEKPTGRPELLGEDADTGVVAQHVVVPEHVDHVDPGLHRADERQREPMGQADIDLLVRRVRRIVRVADASPEALPVIMSTLDTPSTTKLAAVPGLLGIWKCPTNVPTTAASLLVESRASSKYPKPCPCCVSS